MKKKLFIVFVLSLIIAVIAAAATVSVFADDEPVDTAAPIVTAEGAPSEVVEESADNTTSVKAIVAAAVVGVVAAVGALSMGMSICKSADSMARQPEAADKINSAMMLGLVFIETAIIYALIIAILVIFVLL